MGRAPDPNSINGRIRGYLSEHPLAGPTEVATALGMDPAIVSNRMAKLRRAEATRIVRAKLRKRAAIIREKGRQIAAVKVAKAEIIEAASLLPPPTPSAPAVDSRPLDEIERIKTAALDPTKRLEMMAELASRAKDEVTLRALVAIHDLQTQAGAVGTLVVPTTPDEKITRLCLIFRAAGEDLCRAALVKAFAPEEAPVESTEAPPDSD